MISLVIFILPLILIYRSWCDAKGFRAIAIRDIRKGEILSEYCGSPVPDEEFSQRNSAIYSKDAQMFPSASYKWRGKKTWDAYRYV